jgi:hypothetical protein
MPLPEPAAPRRCQLPRKLLDQLDPERMSSHWRHLRKSRGVSKLLHRDGDNAMCAPLVRICPAIV